MIYVQLLTRDDADRVTKSAQEEYAEIDTALKAARRLAGAPRRKFQRDPAGTLSLPGPRGTAYVVR